MTPPQIVFRVDGGAGIGLGHLQRCLSLAAAARGRGAEATFVVNRDPAVLDRVRQAGWPSVAVAGRSWTSDDRAALLAVARARAAAIVVVDSDLDPPDYLGSLRDAGMFVCAIDDNAHDDVQAHVLVNGDAHAERQTYRSTRGDTEWLLGPRYALVAPGYTDGIAEPHVPARTALLTVGGADPGGLMPALLRAASDAEGALRWEIVIGPFVTLGDESVRRLASMAARATVHRAPATLRDQIARADVALMAAGQTLYETAALGRPAVAIAVAANQRPQLEAFARQGAVIAAGESSDPDIAATGMRLLLELAADGARLRAMRAAGQAFIDGRGAGRVIDRLLTLAGTAPA